MSDDVRLTIDVEDFYDGMEVLGHHVERPESPNGALASLLSYFPPAGSPDVAPKVTLFVVGNYATRIQSSLEALVAEGHEIASHGVDHGALPSRGVVSWLRSGRESLEDLLGVPVRGFRSPRFDIPGDGCLARYRDQLAAAGYDYVSDTRLLGAESPVQELPVMIWHRLPLGGGSYQRLLPPGVVGAAVRRHRGKTVLYYHSYDFDGSLPGLSRVRSLALARQLLGRPRIATTFSYLAGRFGSASCGDYGS